ncbi:hypothetical protein ES703_119960 [subsurface metagenome]
MHFYLHAFCPVPTVLLPEGRKSIIELFLLLPLVLPGSLKEALHSFAAKGSAGDIFQGLLQLLIAFGRHPVPAGLVFHEGHALALDCIGDNHRGLILDPPGLGKGSQDPAEGMAVNLNNMPVESPVFIRQGLDAHNILHPAVNLKPVAVYNTAQIVQPIMSGGHHRLPGIALLLLSVSHDAVDAVILFIHLSRKGAAAGNAQSLA